jgi:class III poly(R)-hydroxyalkanoic acid synthase PhaE subunit
MANTQGSDFESLARQYWNAWGETMRQGGAAATPSGAPGWQDAVDWWSKLARGDGADANGTVDRFNAQARDWYGQMQQVAAKYAGQHASAADITAEWKRALGAIGENPFPEMFKAMQGPGAQGFDQWTEGAKPFLDAWRREGKTILGMPAFGSGREQQERLQKLMQAQLDLQQREAAYNALMMKALQRAYGVFQDKLAEREEPGRQLTSARALFDLWIDAAEEAYAQVALSPEFREVYGAYVNAQMRLRNGMQGEIEQVCAAMGMPTRTEVDAAHRKIAELERVLRRMQDAGESAGNAANPEPRASAGAKPAVARKPAAKRTAVSKKKPATKPASTAKRKR